MEQKKSFLESIDGKNALILGIVGGLLSVGTIGFIILSVYMFKNRPTISQTLSQNTIPLPSVSPENNQKNQPTNSMPSDAIPGVNNDIDHIRGDKNAPITIVEYSDFECPFCQRFHVTMQKVMENYNDKVRWVYRHFPLTSIHPNAQKLAEGAECAKELGGNETFWKYADAIFATDDYSNDSLGRIATQAGLNKNKFLSCLTSGKYTTKIQEQTNSGAAAGITGTPGSFLITKDGKAQLISGAVPYETIKAALDAELIR